LTYGASADLNTYKRAGGIIADTDTRTETTTEALRVVVDEFARLQKEPVGDVELSSAQAYLAGNFPLTIETSDSIAMQVLNVLFYELDLKDLQNFPERVNAITAADIQRVAQQYLKPARLSVVLVGDASKFASQLKGVGFDDVELVTLPELDLTTVDFRRVARPAGAGAAH
jgi:zinc protease